MGPRATHEGVRPHLRKPAKGRRFVRFCLPPNGVVALTGASQTGFQIMVAVKLRAAIERGGQTGTQFLLAVKLGGCSNRS